MPVSKFTSGMGGEIDLAVSSYCDNVQIAVNSMINLHDITVTDVSTGSAIGPTLSMASGIPTVITNKNKELYNSIK
ncbi:hypothetical protein [Nemorincola caseinilytica]